MEADLNFVGREGQLRFQERAAWNERFVAACLQTLHAAPDAEEGLRRLLAFLGEGLGCDRVYVFEDLDRRHISNTYEWCASGVSSGIEQLPYLDKKDLHPWYGRLAAGETVVEKDVAALRHREALIGEILTRQGIHTIVLSPLMAEGGVRGVLGADNPPVGRMEQIPVLFGVLANFVLGLVSRRELARLRMAGSPRPQAPGVPRFEGKKLLIVDDSPELLRLNQRVLSPEGYVIRAADSLGEAREQLAREVPDVILMDIDLPDGDGLAFCRALRETMDVPVVFLTAHTELSVKRQALSGLGSAFLTKPYNLEELRRAVADAVAGRRTHTLDPEGGTAGGAAPEEKEEIQ